MTGRRVHRAVWISLALASAAISFLAAFGVLLTNDTVGKIVFATAWGAVAIAWLGRYLTSS